jgi:hypothetical protein
MLYISICLTLLTLLASLLYLSKIKSEGLGMIHKVINWVVLVTAGVILVAQLAQGCKRILHRSGSCHGNETSYSTTETSDGGRKIRKEIRKVRGNKHHGSMGCDVACGEMTTSKKECCSHGAGGCQSHGSGEKMLHEKHDAQTQEIIKDSVVIIK